MLGENCRCCKNSIDSDKRIVLWDGNIYCHECVESQSPSLAHYASTHMQLEERGPDVGYRVIWKHLKLEAALFLIFAVLFTTLFELSKAIKVALIVVSIQALVQIPAFLWRGSRAVPIVIAKNGWIECHRYLKKGTPLFRVPLHTIKWKPGTATMDSSWRFTMIQQEVLILCISQQDSKMLPRCEYFACGWTSEFKELWTAFFCLAGIRILDD